MYTDHQGIHDLVSQYEDWVVAIVFTFWIYDWIEDRVKKYLSRKKPKLLPDETIKRLAELDEKVARLERGTIAEIPQLDYGEHRDPLLERLRQIDHEGHGAGSPNGGPVDSDCPCRGTERQAECARVAGCGFCSGHGA